MIPAKSLRGRHAATDFAALIQSLPAAGAWLVPKRTAHTAAPPLTLKHIPLPTLPARPVRVEHVGRDSLSQTAILAFAREARYLIASMHHPEKRLICAGGRVPDDCRKVQVVSGGTRRTTTRLKSSLLPNSIPRPLATDQSDVV